LLGYTNQLSETNGSFRPGIVHRLDKDTSGLLLIAKTNEAHRFYAEQLKRRTLKRSYYALVHGVIKEKEGEIIAPIGRDEHSRIAMDVKQSGKEATTHFEVVERFSKHTLIKCHLDTGRTHQIRVHMKFIQHPIESDPLYSKGYSHLHPRGQLLHAYRLSFPAIKSKTIITVEAEIPSHFKQVVDALRNRLRFGDTVECFKIGFTNGCERR
jgi:23S rRNA pseudouridine1911/1915/1917 synthase